MDFSEQPSTFRIHCKTDPTFFVSIRDGKVVLAPSNPSDQTQHWFKETFKAVDTEGVSCYALVNKATNQAIKSSEQDQLVTLVPYKKNKDVVDLSLMWSEATDSDHVGYKSIRKGGDIKLYFDAKRANVTVEDGANIILWTRNLQNNQWWKMEEYKPPLPELKGPTYRLMCRGNESLSLSIKQGKIVLVKHDPKDNYQKWYKDGRHGSKVKDMHGLAAFSLINKATRQAIKLDDAGKGTVKPAYYHPDNPDQTFLWGNRDSYSGLRNVITRKPHYDKERLFNVSGGTAKDGVEVITTSWIDPNNQNWKSVESN